jgi:succinate-acetate transporter protein
MDRRSKPPTPFQRRIAQYRRALVVVLSALLLLDLVVGALDLAGAKGLAAVGSIGGAVGILGALVSFRAVFASVDSWDIGHCQPGPRAS